MKKLTIEWDILRNGEFPIDDVQNCGLSVTVEKISIFKRRIEMLSTTKEDITPELAFEIGCMVTTLCLSRVVPGNRLA